MTYELVQTNKDNGVDYVKVEIEGLSTETKPTQVEGRPLWNGSTYFELDTRKVYFWSMLNEEWLGA